MSKTTKLCHFVVVDGTQDEIKSLSTALSEIKKKLPYDIEFLVTNDKIQLYDVSYLIKELVKLYKQNNKLKSDKNE